MATSPGITSLLSVDTVYSADVVEWCPVRGDLFFTGTYQLQEKEGDVPARRKGSEILLSVCKSSNYNSKDTDSGGDGGGASSTILVKQWRAVRLVDAILDSKWSLNTLCSASAHGDLVFCTYDLEIDDSDSKDKRIVHKYLEDGFGLSLDWSTAVNRSQPKIAISDTTGSIGVMDPTTLQRLHYWHAHDFEAWICAFDYHNPDVVYHGGDDAILKGTDTRGGYQPIFKSKVHEMGVTSIQKCANDENILATGSYDEHALIWDLRSLKRPLHDLCLDGGVWRLKFDPCSSDRLFAACMRGGFKVIQGIKASSPTVTLNYGEHDSLAYGADWSHEDLKVGDLPETAVSPPPREGEEDDERAGAKLGSRVGGEVGGVTENFSCHNDDGHDNLDNKARLLGDAGAIYTSLDNEVAEEGEGERRLMASCSFYDHCLRLWMAPIAKETE